MSVQIIEREGKPEYAVLVYEDYLRLVEEAEMLDDIRAYDQAKAELERGADELIPWAISVRLMEAVSRIRVWREYRGITQAALADAAGVSKSAISQMEAGKRQPSVAMLNAIAKRLGVEINDLVANEAADQ